MTAEPETVASKSELLSSRDCAAIEVSQSTVSLTIGVVLPKVPIENHPQSLIHILCLQFVH